MIMPIDHIPDWEKRLARMDAFWDRQIIDRPAYTITCCKPAPTYQVLEKQFGSLRDRWLDAEYIADTAIASAMNMEYFGDALPHAYPNLGPEVFSAFFGLELDFGENTSWSRPLINEWNEDLAKVCFSRDNFYWKNLIEITQVMLEKGRGKFYTGLTDFHPGGDAIAAFRDPLNLNTDLLLYPDEVRRLLNHVTDTYFMVYDFFHDMLAQADQAISTWSPLVSNRKWYIPSNDFSCMISNTMFRDFFLPGIIQECCFYQNSLYHLDGPDALQHLDSLLEIPELNAVQWIWGAGNGHASDWLPIFQRCQSAGKGVEIYAEVNDIDMLIGNLRPEGALLHIFGVGDADEAKAIGKRILRWR